MKKLLCILFSIMSISICLCQNDLIINRKSDNTKIDLSCVDSMISNESSQTIFLSIPENEIESISLKNKVNEGDINHNGTDKKTYFNKINKLILDISNEKHYTDFKVDDDTIIIPQHTDFSNIKSQIKANGEYIFFNGKTVNKEFSGNYSSTAKLTCAASNGDKRKYSVTVINSGLPILSIKTENSNLSDWHSASLTINNSNGSEIITSSTEIKEKNSNNKKKEYRLKFVNKTKLLNMPSGKRWVLLPCETDKTKTRAHIAFFIYKNYLLSCWTPSCKPVELIINNSHQGTYLLTEQIRQTKERVSDGLILSIENKADKEDDHFESEITNNFYKFVDPEAGSNGTRLIRTKNIIKDFEFLLINNDNFTDFIDKKSFADWFIINEIVMNCNAFSDNANLIIKDYKKIIMGPIWDMSSYLATNKKTSGFVTTSHLWGQKILDNPEMKKIIKERFLKVYLAKNEIIKEIDKFGEIIIKSSISDNKNTEVLGPKETDYTSLSKKFNQEKEELKKWLTERLEWMNNNLN